MIQGIQQEKENIDKLKMEAEQAERNGDFGRVAEIRYGKLLESENKLQQLKGKMVEMQGEIPLQDIGMFFIDFPTDFLAQLLIDVPFQGLKDFILLRVP